MITTANVLLEGNNHIVECFIEAVWNHHDLDALPTFWSDDYVNHAMPPPYSRGADALRAMHAAYFAAAPDLRVTILDQVAEGDRVCTYLESVGTHGEEFLGMAATGKRFATTSMRIDRIAGGKSVEHWLVADRRGLMQQLQG